MKSLTFNRRVGIIGSIKPIVVATAIVVALVYLFTPVSAAAPNEGDGDPPIWQVALVATPRLESPEPPKTPEIEKPAPKPAVKVAEERVIRAKTASWSAFITGYNTVAAQTDSTPCTAAGGPICGRRDVVACPTSLPLHTWVEINGKAYECMDRTAPKHNGRFDISCDKDMACPHKITGWGKVRVIE